MNLRRILTAVMVALLLIPTSAWAAEPTPAQAAETLRARLLQGQLSLAHAPAAALADLQAARASYTASLAAPILAAAPSESQRIDSAWLAAEQALAAANSPDFAAARAQIWTGVLAGSYQVVERALASGDTATAQRWLAVREFRVATRFSRPAADATLAIAGAAAGTTSPADAQLALKADLLDTYQARLTEALNTLRSADARQYPTQRAEAGALAVGYFQILAPAYREQRGAAAAAAALTTFDQLGQAARKPCSVASTACSAAEVEQSTATLTTLLKSVMPEEWQKTNLSGDFDVIASLLDQMERAAAAGEYDLAESARLEAYAVLEAGPEARLVVFAPQYKAPIEDLFWYGQNEDKGLAHLISQGAPLSAIRHSRAALDEQLALAQVALGGDSSPLAVALNAAIIVFREGLEAVLILASLLGSLKLGENRKLRRPIWLGAALAFVATGITWMFAQGLLRWLMQELQVNVEMLEAVVSLIAIGVLLLITNWFFHKVYWTGWMANFHTKKRSIIGGAAGIWVGLIMLGFTSIYREGFETVLFLQALVLDAGTAVVLGGVGVGLLGTLLVGLIVFGLQAKLPHKKMLIATGILIGVVLLQMVGNTIHVMQVVGWLPIHPIRALAFPYWSGLWFGLYATWEGLALQLAAATFVIGSYVLAEHLQQRRARVATKRQATARG